MSSSFSELEFPPNESTYTSSIEFRKLHSLFPRFSIIKTLCKRNVYQGDAVEYQLPHAWSATSWCIPCTLKNQWISDARKIIKKSLLEDTSSLPWDTISLMQIGIASILNWLMRTFKTSSSDLSLICSVWNLSLSHPFYFTKSMFMSSNISCTYAVKEARSPDSMQRQNVLNMAGPSASVSSIDNRIKTPDWWSKM